MGQNDLRTAVILITVMLMSTISMYSREVWGNMLGSFTCSSVNSSGAFITAGTHGICRVSYDRGRTWKFVYFPYYDNVSAVDWLLNGEVVTMTETSKLLISSMRLRLWKEITLPQAGKLTAMTICNDSIYILVGQVLYRSTDYGLTWENILKSTKVYNITKYVDGGSIILGALCDSLQILKTTNGGISFEIVKTAKSLISALSDPSALSFAMSPNIIAIGNVDTLAVYNYKTNDQSTDTMPGNIKSIHCRDNTVYCLTSTQILVTASPRVKKNIHVFADIGIANMTRDAISLQDMALLSDDSLIVLGSNNMITLCNHTMDACSVVSYIDPSNLQDIKVNSHGFGLWPGVRHIYRTTDNGATWKPEGRVNLQNIGQLPYISASLVNDSVYYCTTRMSFTALKSRNFGETWDSVFNVFTGQQASVIVPFSESNALCLYNMISSRWAVIVTRTSDSGNSWKQFTAIDSCAVEKAVQYNKGLYVACRSMPTSQYDSISGNTITTHHDSFIAYTDDQFQTRKVVKCPLSSQNITGFDWDGGTNIVLCTIDSQFTQIQFYISTDNGISWSMFDSSAVGLTYIPFCVSYSLSKSKLYYTNVSGIYKRNANELSWHKMETGTTSTYTTLVPFADENMYVAGHDFVANRDVNILMHDDSIATSVANDESDNIWLVKNIVGTVSPIPCSDEVKINLRAFRQLGGLSAL